MHTHTHTSPGRSTDRSNRQSNHKATPSHTYVVTQHTTTGASRARCGGFGLFIHTHIPFDHQPPHTGAGRARGGGFGAGGGQGGVCLLRATGHQAAGTSLYMCLSVCVSLCVYICVCV